jgi:2,3-bisphosphoglycerate-independent phosphoglycerate mutase
VLVIMDGVGVGLGDAFDAVALANTPALDRLKNNGRYRTLRAHGRAVGLSSDDDMGNSEVGHNIMGAGRIFDQGAQRIEKAIRSGAIWQSDAWASTIATCRHEASTLHLLGLLSDGNVHSHIDHLIALIDKAVADRVIRIRIHALFDGRDVPDHTAEHYVEQLRQHVAELGDVDVQFASGGGRMVTTMDRYGADWSVVEAGWQAHVEGTAHAACTIDDGIAWGRSTQPGIGDQFLPAFTVIDEAGQPVGALHDGDAVIFFNFRGDRAIEFSRAIEAADGEFAPFVRHSVPQVCFAGMALYDGDLGVPSSYLVQPESVDNTVSEVIADAGLRQWACAETQKFGHVTYFWNGNRSSKFNDELETYLEIPSDIVPFDQRPWMKSAETADAAVAAIRSEDFDVLRMNFAGGDMVGHTADVAATRIAVEAVDLAIGRIAMAVDDAHGCLIVTADHGNADDMVERLSDGTARLDDAGAPIGRTAHSLNPVPFYICDFTSKLPLLRADLTDAGLSNVAGTLLQLLGIEVPSEYAPGLLESDNTEATT